LQKVEESKNDAMHAAYMPRVITKESLLSASPSQLEMLLQHVVLVKDPAVPEKFKPRWVDSSLILMSSTSKPVP
jgi:hypothetical protein